MAAFEYVALDAKGREQKGVTEGETPRHVRQLLRNQGLMPVSITEAAVKDKKQTEEKPSAFSFQRGISATDLALFTRQLATLLSASLPLEESLAAVGQQFAARLPREPSGQLSALLDDRGPQPCERGHGRVDPSMRRGTGDLADNPTASCDCPEYFRI